VAYEDLGHMYGQFARWNEARATYDKADELNPANPWDIYCAAILRLRAGDLPGYRRACRAMLERFGNTKQGWVADITAKTCLLMPKAVNDLGRVNKLADLAVTLDPDNKWFQLVKGLAEYRAGRHAEAVKWLDRLAPRADGGAIDVCAFAVLAMARHRLERAPDARAALNSAEAILAKNAASRPRGEPVEDWTGWLHGQVLRREAKALLEGSEVKKPESEKKPK
jgi:tetratricopeptide (TPR) repeat protein